MTFTLESRPPHSVLIKERRKVRGFKTADAMHTFLATGDNSLRWREPHKDGTSYGLTPGTYAWAGGRWHNIKTLDASILAHI